MAVLHPILVIILTGCSLVAGLLALHGLIRYQQRGTSTMPPFPYNDTTLRDFELLSAAGGLLLFASFLTLVAGLYERTAVQAALPVPIILLTVILIILLYRWRRRI